MKDTFKEYQQFSDKEFKQLWKTGVFVFDTNTLLNMYRYSRSTVDAYFEVLNELKKRNQLWIPYQVGYEFYENRINVIAEYEKSYDDILNILEQSKNSIQKKYKDHPFLNLVAISDEINKSLNGVEIIIKEQKKQHPKWLEKDDVLEKINEVFKGNVGANYEEKKLAEIRKLGAERYAQKIPPGHKDSAKSEDKKYGDLILWFQIIDKAKEVQRPIIFISGDAKEDWWLEKDGRKIMPLPQLKKEMLDKSKSSFHIYTADRFLEYFKADIKVDERAIKEVKKIRELEEEKTRMQKVEKKSSEYEGITVERMRLVEGMWGIINDLLSSHENEISPRFSSQLSLLSYNLNVMRGPSGQFEDVSFSKVSRVSMELLNTLRAIVRSGAASPNAAKQIVEYIDLLVHLQSIQKIH